MASIDTVVNRRANLITSNEIIQRLIAQRKEYFKVGKNYRLLVNIPTSVLGNNTRKEVRNCTCAGVYEHWVLFTYISPYTGNICKRGYRWSDIPTEVVDGSSYSLNNAIESDNYLDIYGGGEPEEKEDFD